MAGRYQALYARVGWLRILHESHGRQTERFPGSQVAGHDVGRVASSPGWGVAQLNCGAFGKAAGMGVVILRHGRRQAGNAVHGAKLGRSQS